MIPIIGIIGELNKSDMPPAKASIIKSKLIPAIASTSKPRPMIMPTEIMVRKSAHALVIRERWVPNLYTTESNMPSLTVTIMIPKTTSAVIRKLPPNILGIRPYFLLLHFAIATAAIATPTAAIKYSHPPVRIRTVAIIAIIMRKNVSLCIFLFIIGFLPSRLYAAVEIHPSFCRLCPYSRNRLKFLARQQFLSFFLIFFFTTFLFLMLSISI